MGGSVAGRFESLTSEQSGVPLAVPLAELRRYLDLEPAPPRARLAQAVQAVQPYTHADGSPRWSVMLVRRALGEATAGSRRDARRERNRQAVAAQRQERRRQPAPHLTNGKGRQPARPWRG
jgi:hypothetical protein